MEKAKAWIFGALGILVLAVAGVFAVRALTSNTLDSAPEARQSLEDAWASTIQRFGIEPVFPPEEDLSVGDILAVVVADNEADPNLSDKKVDRGSPLLKRSVKLAHVDVRAQLRDAYAMLPVFTTAPAVQAAPRPGSEQAGGPPTVAPSISRSFDPEVLQSNLPRAAFPSLKIQGINTAGAGLSGGGRGSADFGRNRQGLEEIHLAEVRAYGLPSVRALELLNAHCAAEKTKADCREQTARWHLRQIVGDRINNKYVDDQGENRYAMSVEVVMVSRVYLTRSIAHVRRSETSERGGFRLTAPTPALLGESAGQPTPAASPSAPPTTDSNASGADALRKRLEELEAQLANARAAGALLYSAMSGNEVAFQEQFDRPVAIGYRSVRFDLAEAGAPK